MSSHFTKWIDNNSWVCSKHLPSVVMPASSGLCAFSTCESTRPKRESFTNIGTSTMTAAKKSPVPAKSIRKKRALTPKATVQNTVQTPMTATVDVEMCAWFKCTKGENGGPAPARSRSKYCGRACSNANARWNHKQRAKENKDVDGK